MAFQSSGAQPPQRTASYGSSSVSTAGSAEAASDAGTDAASCDQMEPSVSQADAENGSEETTESRTQPTAAESQADSDAQWRSETSPLGGSGDLVPPAPVFPNLPEQLLKDLRDHPTEQDIENRFSAISIAFKTDKLTLDERVSVQKRWRDQAELNMIQEENNLRAAIQNLYYLCKDSTSVEIVTKVKEQVDILRWAVDWLARSSESVGAIQQENRVSKAMDVMLQYVENLKRIQDKHDEEGKKRLKHQSEDLTDTDESPARTVRIRSLQPIPNMGKTGSKRRASIGAILRPSSGYTETSRLSVCLPPLYLEGIPRSDSLSRSGSFTRRTSLTQSIVPSTPSTTSWGSTDNLDTFDLPKNAVMDNIEEINESRRESCSSRLEPEEHSTEENNNYSLKRLSCDNTDKNNSSDPMQNASTIKKLYLSYDQYMMAIDAAKDTVMDYLETDNIVFMIRRAVAFLLILAALYYLVAMFFEPATAATTINTQIPLSSCANSESGCY